MAKYGKVSGWVYKCELEETPLLYGYLETCLSIMPIVKTKSDLYYFCECQAAVRPLKLRRRKNNCVPVKVEYTWRLV